MIWSGMWFGTLLSMGWLAAAFAEESSSQPFSCCELTQTLYPLGLQYGPRYQPLSSFSARVSFQLRWKTLFPWPEREVVCLLQVQDQSLVLLGSDLTRLEADLFADPEGVQPVIFFTGQNAEEAGILLPVEEGLPYLQQTLTLQIPAKQKVPAGSYRCFVDCCLYTVGGELLHRQPIQLLVEVADYQILSLGSSAKTTHASHGALDFGDTQAPSTQSVSLQIESNELCALSVSSFHGGKLVLRGQYGPSEGRHSYIPYDCWVGGGKVVLTEIPQFVWMSRAKPCLQNVEVAVRIYPDCTLNWAGTYEDELVFCLKSMQ